MRFFLLALLSTTSLFAAEIDWAQPPVECLEESVPRPPRGTCPDLTQVTNVSTGWPANITARDKFYWSTLLHKDMRICRAQEIMRRESLQPGTFSAASVEYAWMQVESIKDHLVKRWAVNKASIETKIPQSLLPGAILQESVFANLGIYFDGGNYSCGLGQLNPLEWCSYMESLPAAEQASALWPTRKISEWKLANPGKAFCSNPHFSLNLMDGFYRRAKANLNGLPEYRLNKSHFQGFDPTQIMAEFPAASALTQETRYAALKAFIDGCNHVGYAIRGKARTLANIFTRYVPKGLQEVQMYSAGQTFKRSCAHSWKSPYYPAHPGWMMAIAIYNVGPRAAEMAQHYLQMSNEEFRSPDTWTNTVPQDLVNMIYWSGKHNANTDLIEFKSPAGATREIPWYRQCITQRHTANTLRNVTRLGQTLVTAGNKGVCPRSVFDSNGVLLESRVPAERRAASGVQE